MNTNLAILGLTRFIKEDSDEAKALIERGYKKTPWGEGMLKNETIRSNWSEFFMVGYSDADYAAKKAPIYLVPMNETVCTTTGLKNGYGFKSTAN